MGRYIEYRDVSFRYRYIVYRYKAKLVSLMNTFNLFCILTFNLLSAFKRFRLQTDLTHDNNTNNNNNNNTISFDALLSIELSYSIDSFIGKTNQTMNWFVGITYIIGDELDCYLFQRINVS